MASVVPPWGIEDGGNRGANSSGFRNERGGGGGGGGRFVPGRGRAAGDVVSSALELRQASVLSERNILLDELIQVKKELQLSQMETRRMGEAFVQRLGVVESRIMASEANTRTLDKREAGSQQSLAQARSEIELKIREMVAEVARFKLKLEADVRGQIDVLQGELRQRDTALLQVEAQAREWVRHSRSADEQRAKMENEIKVSVERRLLVLQDATRKMETSIIDRVASLEHLIQKEADERVKGDEESRRHFEEAANILRKRSEREALAIEQMQENLRSDLDGVVQATQSQLIAFREEAERGRARLHEGLEDERMQRCDGEEEVKRKLDTLMKLYEVERERLRDATRSAVEQMMERTKTVQEVSKSIQQEGVRIKSMAARVEQQAMGGLKALVDKVEDGFHVLRAVQDRHALQIQENRQASSTALQDLRDKVQQAHQRVETELEKNFQDDRQMRQDLTKRIDDCEEAAEKAERRQSSAFTELEDRVRHTLEAVGKDVETLSFRSSTALTDVEGETHELKQRVHSVEVLSEQRFAGHADDIRVAHARMWDEILHLKSSARGMAAVDQELRLANTLHLQKLAAVVKNLGGSVLAFERGARVAPRVEELGRETARIEQDLLGQATHISDINARGHELVQRAERSSSAMLIERAERSVSAMSLGAMGLMHVSDMKMPGDLVGVTGGGERGEGGKRRTPASDGLSDSRQSSTTSSAKVFAQEFVADILGGGMAFAEDSWGETTGTAVRSADQVAGGAHRDQGEEEDREGARQRALWAERKEEADAVVLGAGEVEGEGGEAEEAFEEDFEEEAAEDEDAEEGGGHVEGDREEERTRDVAASKIQAVQRGRADRRRILDAQVQAAYAQRMLEHAEDSEWQMRGAAAEPHNTQQSDASYAEEDDNEKPPTPLLLPAGMPAATMTPPPHASAGDAPGQEASKEIAGKQAVAAHAGAGEGQLAVGSKDGADEIVEELGEEQAKEE